MAEDDIKTPREILAPEGIQSQHARPVRSENRATLIASIARGRRWLEELTTAADAIEDELQEALAICGGGAIAALIIRLIANAFLEAEIDRVSAAVSSGFAPGKVRTAIAAFMPVAPAPMTQ